MPHLSNFFGSMDVISESSRSLTSTTVQSVEEIDKIVDMTGAIAKDAANFRKIAEKNIAASNELTDLMRQFRLK